MNFLEYSLYRGRCKLYSFYMAIKYGVLAYSWGIEIEEIN